MKTKSHNLTPQLLSTHRVQKLGLNWQDLFNPSLAIHANRELNMSKIKLVGFDMDYTLAVYKKLPMETLQYDLARNYLIEKMSYPHELKKRSFDHGLLIRGLVVDKQLGNVLKLDDQNYVWRASHCRRELSPDETLQLYGTKRIKVGDNRYYSLDTFFSIPEACLFVDTIECLSDLKNHPDFPSDFVIKTGDKLDFNKIFTDIRLAMDTIHSDNSLKTVISENTDEFIVRDLEIEAALRKLKSEGKKLFLLTNSSFEYTNTVLNFVFDCKSYSEKNWLELFDMIIVEAEKPLFFTATNPFVEVSRKKHSMPAPVFRGGNINDFHRMCNVRGQEVLYVGDHIYGDILRSKKDSLWRTCLIIKELNFDIRKTTEHKNDFKTLRQIQNEQGLADKRLMRLRTLLGMLQNQFQQKGLEEDENLLILMEHLKHEIKHSTSILQKLKERHLKLNREIEDKFHPTWGRLFRENQELSRFGAQVRQYACIYTDHLKNFLHYGANHTFFARKEMMTHEIDLE